MRASIRLMIAFLVAATMGHINLSWCQDVAKADGTAAPAYPHVVPPGAPAENATVPDTIRFVTADDFPPFNFFDGNGVLTGFNVELARTICTRLAITCTIQVRPFALLVDTLAANKADAIIAGVADTPALRRHLDYSLPYFRLPARFVTARPLAGISPESLVGRRIAVREGSSYAAYLADFFPAAAAVPVADDGRSFALLKAGEVDAVFAGAVAASFWLAGPNAAGCCAFSGGAYTESAYFGDGLTIAVARGNRQLKATLDNALRDLDGQGVLADLALRFFPTGLY